MAKATQAAKRTAEPPQEKEQHTGTDVAETQGRMQALAEAPDFMRQDAGKGLEHLSGEDFEMPRVKLIQGVSEEIMTYNGLQAGQFFHVLAEENLGSNVRTVILHLSKRYVLWRPRAPIDMGGILARADDFVHWDPPNQDFKVKIDKSGTEVVWRTARTVRESGLAAWGTYNPSDPNSQPAATLCYVAVAAFPDFQELGPSAIMLQRSAVKPARKLSAAIRYAAAKAPMWGLVFEMSSYMDKSDSGPYHNYRFEGAGFVPKNLYDEYTAIAEVLAKTGVRVKDIGEADEPAMGGVSRQDYAEAAREENRF